VDDRFPGEPRLADPQQRNIGGGAAHVEGDDVLRAGEAGRHLRPDDAGARPRQYRPNRQPRRCVEPDYATV
jgi:hypothetical protein